MSFKETEFGMIPKDWKIKQIGEIGKVVGGGTPRTKVEEYWNGDVSWITPKDLSGYSDRFIYKGERSITQVGLENSSAKLLPKGTVLFSSRAPIGYVAIAGKDMSTNQGFKSIVCNEKVTNNLFIYYLMKQKKTNIEMIAGGSTFKEVSGKVLKEFKIQIPPLNEQKAIANILSTLDEKIEINNKINKNLEEMAQAIFRRWFVDFEFPNEQGKPYKSSGGEMVESELGLIPKGWKVKTLGDVLLKLEAGNRPKGGAGNLIEGIPSIGAENIIGLGQYDYSKEKYVTEEYFNNMKKGIVNSGDVMLYKDGAQLGRKTMFMDGFPHKRCCVNSHVFILRTNEIISQLFLYFWLDQKRVTKSIINLNENSAQPGINQSKVKSLKILVPKSEIVKDFDETILKMIKKLFENCNENSKLEKIRDTLLPKLMSGEIRVPLESENDAL
ncbi:restriction endonuclease subunit S [Geotoga petraea]|uniref:Restriction endonuclease subunit S n=1 Tax=Geotoga petraea TaxID=28234 RepID=A0A4Z0VZK4_9BACT|nr:restriction endonuclease subunit S [Geotoga petraea]TGG87507.1 restriction endonuclease subunit S [Geotoga petraea]